MTYRSGVILASVVNRLGSGLKLSGRKRIKGSVSTFKWGWSREESSEIRLLSRRSVINPPKFVTRASPTDKIGNVATAARSLINREKMSAKVTSDAIIWVDCEMSGLDVNSQTIMEIACIITGPKLDTIARQDSLIIKTSDEILDSMDTWCTQHHGESGLTESCRTSNLTLEQAESILLDFVSLHTKPGSCPMAGNSIHADRMFIQKYMPRFHNHFHYRNIDVSTIKELARRWYPQDFSNAPAKVFAHRTMSDIEESIKELNYYRSVVFKEPVDLSGC